ncbi:amino acid ABC transporter permease [Paenibacillus sediminis]|uniref:Polar amino acid transport system permease protein n=1 Tax=Paenibacillus sediminis TaxID=664909 RepID=A0ABS4H1L3_9BACL|nr:amino acid ABC transporter permease [Paenibacillus sediminis]MBP1936157.1 polar amino acid transport system permease protein [Paenibacillus sediminis]
MQLDTDFMTRHIPDFVHAAGLSLSIGGIAILLSLSVACIYSAILFFQVPILKGFVRAHVEVARNTPLLIQLFFLYYGLPSIGIKLSSMTVVFIAMTFLGGGYFTEVFRSGLDAVTKTQAESGLALGLSRMQLFRYVIMPQAFRISIPALFANFIFLLKETTIVSAVAVPELLYTTTSYISLYYKTYEMLLMMTICYLIIFLPLSFLLSCIERRYQYGTHGH